MLICDIALKYTIQIGLINIIKSNVVFNAIKVDIC